MKEPQFKQLRQAYGFDDVAIVPGDVTLNPAITDTSWNIGDIKFDIPIMGAAMDGSMDVAMAVKLSKLGGLGVLHLEGVQTRFDDPQEALTTIIDTSQEEVTAVMQDFYSRPIKEELIAARIKEIKAASATTAVSVSPMNAHKYAKIIKEAGADIMVVSATLTTARFISGSQKPALDLPSLCKEVGIPVVVGNSVTYSATLELMRTGVAAVLIGVGPGSACTTREVLGLGVPQVTATIDCAAARDMYFTESGRYVPIVTDGGINRGGSVCKAMAAGADAVMLGSLLAQTIGAPGQGYHWGMANPNSSLPRGTRIYVGTNGTVEQYLFGPTSVTDGSQNLIGALKTLMGNVGALNIAELHEKAEIIIAPAIKSEGKSWQLSQHPR